MSDLVCFLFICSFITSCRFLSAKQIAPSDQEESNAVSISTKEGVSEEKQVITKELFSRGETLYQKQCAVCHGVTGEADGKAAYLLYPKARDFKRDKFRLVSSVNMEATDGDLFKTITRGMPGSAMPPWGHFSENNRWALAYYVRYLSQMENYRQTGEFTGEEIPWESKEKIIRKKMDPENLISVPVEPATTQEALQRGRELFVASCASCHGMEGKGDGQQVMSDILGNLSKPRDLTAGIFKGDSSSQELYYRMIGGMPGSPMPSYLGVFNEEQIWDLIHYVQTLPKPGAEKRAQLRQSQITTRKISGEIASEPLASQWSDVKSIYIALTPLWWRDDRIEGVEVRALHNGKKIAFHLTWPDPQENQNILEAESFSDGAALQFSDEKEPPFFGMGESDHPVQIWHWKSAWEQVGEKRKDIEDEYPHTAVDYYESQMNYEYASPFETVESKTQFHDPKFLTGWGAENPLSNPIRTETAEEGMSEGLGSYNALLPKVENVQAKGIWKNGKWHVVFLRSLKPSESGSLQFNTGQRISVAFAIWDGSHKDRNGQKMVSIWNELIIEE